MSNIKYYEENKELFNIILKDNQYIENGYLYTKSGCGYPLLICPICYEYKMHMYNHSKSKKCSFDYKKTYPQLFIK